MRLARLVRLDFLDFLDRRLAPPVAGAAGAAFGVAAGAAFGVAAGAAFGVAAGAALGAAAGAAGALAALLAGLANPNKLVTEFKRVPFAALAISTLAQQFFRENLKIFCALRIDFIPMDKMSISLGYM